jgi:hypothetical protein
MDTLATLQQRRDEASTALHQLMLGKSVVEVWRDGRRMNFTGANADALRNYISQIDAQINELTGDPTTSGFRRGSMRARFIRG